MLYTEYMEQIGREYVTNKYLCYEFLKALRMIEFELIVFQRHLI